MLEDADFGTFSAVAAIMDYDVSGNIHAIRRIRTEYEETLPETAEEALDDLDVLHEHVNVARQFFKTLYAERKLAMVSRTLLYAGLPALLVGGVVILSSGELAGSATTRLVRVVFVSATVTIVFIPFFVLFAYMLRIATLANRTVDFGPFVANKPQRRS